MAFKILDRARMSVSGAPSTGTVTLSTAVTGYQSFAQAGLLNGDTFAYSIVDGTKWEFGVGTYISTGTPSFSRAVTKTSNQNSVALDLSSTCIVTAVLRGEDVGQATTFAGLTDVDVTLAAPIDGYVFYWDNTAGRIQAKQVLFADLPDAPTIPTNGSFTLDNLGDVSLIKSSGTNGYSLTWNNATNRFVLTDVSGGGGGGGSLATLSDVTLSSPSSGQVLHYNGSAWVNYSLGLATVATSGVYADLTGKPTLVTALTGLSDVNVTEGSGINGYSLTWDNATSRWVATNVSGGGGGTSLAGLTTDVTISSPTNNQVLTYETSSSKWKNKAAAGGAAYTLTPPDPTALTAVTHLGGSSSVSTTSGGIPSLAVTSGSSDSDSEMYCMMRAVPAGNWSAIAKTRVLSSAGTSGWKSAGLGVLNQSGNKGANIMRADGVNAYVCTFPSGSGFTGGSPVTSLTLASPDQFLHIDYDGTNLTYSLSLDGVNKIAVNTTSASSMIGGAPTHVGITWGSNSSSGAPKFDYFHFYAGAAGTNGL